MRSMAACCTWRASSRIGGASPRRNAAKARCKPGKCRARKENAIQYAIEYMTDSFYSSTDYNEEERAELLEYWSNPNHYIAELDED